MLLLLDKGALSSLTSRLLSLHWVKPSCLTDSLQRLQSPAEMTTSQCSPLSTAALIIGLGVGVLLLRPILPSQKSPCGTGTYSGSSKDSVFCHPDKSVCPSLCLSFIDSAVSTSHLLIFLLLITLHVRWVVWSPRIYGGSDESSWISSK